MSTDQAVILPATQPSAREESHQTQDKKLGRQIAFGLQQTLACWATDFIDPPVSRFLQNKFGNKDHHVTHQHVWYAEALGDTSAFFSYLAVKRFMSTPVDWVITGVKHIFDRRFDSMGRKALKPWARSHQIAETDARYVKKLEEYKDFQAENIVDSTIVASSATAANIGIQRWLGNKQTYVVILGSKLVGAVATMGLMLGLRTGLPTSTKALDDELSERYFSKLIRWTQRQFGVQHETVDTAFSIDDEVAPKRDLAFDKRQRFLASLQRIYTQQHDTDFDTFVAQQKRVCQALVHALYPQGRFAHAIDAQYKAAFSEADQQDIPNMMIHRRDAVLARLKLLDDSSFLSELKTALASEATIIPTNEISPQKREKLIENLLEVPVENEADKSDAIRQKANNQYRQQKALLDAFTPNSEAGEQLASMLEDQLHIDASSIARIYMQERQEAARNVMSELSNDGEVVTEAVRRSETLQYADAGSWRAMVSERTPSHTTDKSIAA